MTESIIINRINIQGHNPCIIEHCDNGIRVSLHRDARVSHYGDTLVIVDTPLYREIYTSKWLDPQLVVHYHLECDDSHIQYVKLEGSATCVFYLPLDDKQCHISIEGTGYVSLDNDDQVFGRLDVLMKGDGRLSLSPLVEPINDIRILMEGDCMIELGENDIICASMGCHGPGIIEEFTIIRDGSLNVSKGGQIMGDAAKNARITEYNKDGGGTIHIDRLVGEI